MNCCCLVSYHLAHTLFIFVSLYQERIFRTVTHNIIFLYFYHYHKSTHTHKHLINNAHITPQKFLLLTCHKTLSSTFFFLFWDHFFACWWPVHHCRQWTEWIIACTYHVYLFKAERRRRVVALAELQQEEDKERLMRQEWARAAILEEQGNQMRQQFLDAMANSMWLV